MTAGPFLQGPGIQLPNSSASTPANPQLIESQVQQLSGASLQGYGQLPNPQAVYEAIMTGATPAYSQALAEGNPLFQSYLAGTPAGATPTGASPYGDLPTTIKDPTANLWSFNPKQHQQGLHDQLGQDQNASWRSFGDLPQLNFGWMDSVRHGDAATVQRWQGLLQKKGYFDSTYQGGVWDPATEHAFQGFMAQRAAPVAIFSGNLKEREQATIFLQGLGIDANTLARNAKDPEKLAQLAQGWMAAQGPDGQMGSKSELQQYADQFGTAALPLSYQALIQNGFFQTIRDGLSSLPLIGDIPVLGGAFHGAVNAITGNLDLKHLTDDPRVVRAQQIQHDMRAVDKLTPNDIKNLTPALQAVQNDAGFLGFLDDYDHTRTKFVLASIYSLGDLVTGKFDGHKDNPFDPMSGANLTAQMHQDSMFAGLFGDQAAQANPVWAGFFNFAANVVDDPTSYLPLLGQLKAVEAVRGQRTAAKVIGNEASRAAFHNLGAETIKTGVNEGWFQVGRTVGRQGKLNDAELSLAAGLSGSGNEHEIAQFKLFKRVIDPETPEAEARQLVLEGDGTTSLGFGWMINSGKSAWNARAAWKAVAQTKDLNHIHKARIMGAFEEHPMHQALSNPVGSAQFLYKAGLVAGLPEAELKPLIDGYMSAALGDPNSLIGAWHKAVDGIMDHYYQTGGIQDSAFRAWIRENKLLRPLQRLMAEGKVDPARFDEFVATRAAGRTLHRPGAAVPGAADKTLEYAPEAQAGHDVSRVPRGGADPEIARANAEQMQRLQEQRALAEAHGANAEQLAVFDEEIAARSRPAPMLVNQLADAMTFPFSLYDMIAYKNPVWRNLELTQAHMQMDAVMGAWKRITVGRISSAFRIDIGDDMIRPAIMLIGTGHPIAAFHYLGESILRAAGLLLPGGRKGMALLGGGGGALGYGLAGPIGAAIGAAVGVGVGKLGVRGRVLKDLERELELNPKLRFQLQTLGKLMSEQESQVFGHLAPGQVGYADNLERFLRDQVIPDPQVKAWTKGYSETDPQAARNAVRDLYEHSDDPKVRAMVEIRNPEGSARGLDLMADGFHDWFGAWARHAKLRQWAGGKLTRAELRKYVEENANSVGQGGLPQTLSRADTPLAHSLVTSLATRGTGAHFVFENVTKPAINIARAKGAKKMKWLYEQQMRNYFKGHPGRDGEAFERMVDQESTSRALDWVQNNTYQGTRSVMGGALRNIFPFYGATANMDRFYMRQASATPFLGSAIVHTMLSTQQTQSAAANQNAPGLTGGEGILAHLGFGGGEGVQFNPLHAFFLTSDGLGSVVPGTGPIFAPLWNAASRNHGLAQWLSEVIPGAQTAIDYNTGQAKATFPWIADLISGASLAATGSAPNLPLIGVNPETVKRQTEAKMQQRERDTGTPVSADELDSIRREVGRDLMLQGALSFTVPASPQVKDLQAARTSQNLDLLRQQTTEQGKDAVIAQTLGVSPQEWSASVTRQAGAPTPAQLIGAKPDSDAALMAYQDHRLSAEDRSAIAQAAPWVVASSTSKYQSTADFPGAATSPVDLAQWQLMRNSGNVSLLEPTAYLGQISKERDINTGWQEYEALKNWEYETLQANNWTSTTPAFRAWKQAMFDPKVIDLQTFHPDWWSQFGSTASGTSAPSLAGATRPLSTLANWEVIPQHSDYENTQSVLWRNAIQLKDQAAQAIYGLRLSHGSRSQQDMVMEALQQQLQGLAAQDPGFAAQLGGFRFGRWEDLVTLGADQLQAAAYTGAV